LPKKISPKSHTYGFGATQQSAKGKPTNLQYTSDEVWLSIYAQHNFYMDLSFPSIKLSGMKFLPCLSETK